MPRKLTMKESIEGVAFSKRLQNVLLHQYDFYPEAPKNLDDVVRAFWEDPAKFRRDFMRLPGAGVKLFGEIRDFCQERGSPQDLAGRIVTVGLDEARAVRGAIDEVRHSVDIHSSLYRWLTRANELFQSSTLYIQQDNDIRPFFDD